MSRTWSNFQTAIFDFVKTGLGNAIVKAVAGSGKTTTIVEALKHAKGSTIFLAFNKAIAVELGKRGVNAKTFHSLGYTPVLRAKKATQRDVIGDKTWKIMDSFMSDQDLSLYGVFLNKLVGLGKQAGIDCLIPDSVESWTALIEHHDLELEHDNATFERAVDLASQVLKLSNESRLIDFDDMLYLVIKLDLSLGKFDFIFVDEAQDTNAIQRAMLKKIMTNNSRMIAVGDPAQAIYGFRGADSDSLDLIAQEFNAIELPLTVSYRCPTAVVEFAHNFVKHIQAAPNAPTGEVLNHGEKWEIGAFNAQDLLVCRTTRPLIALGYALLKERKPFYIMGRDIGQGLKSLVNKMKAKGLDNLRDKLEAYRAREVERATAKGQDAKVEAINDKIDAVLFLVEGLGENERTIAALTSTIDSMFNEKKNATVLSTIHKAKGLEAESVYWLNSSQCPAKWAKQDWQQQQEINLCYVATTRAKQRLVLIEERKANG